MDKFSVEKEMFSFIAASYETVLACGNSQVKTQDVLSKYSDVPNESELCEIFKFMKDHKLIKASDMAIPKEFILLDEALLWAHDTFDRVLNTPETPLC